MIENYTDMLNHQFFMIDVLRISNKYGSVTALKQ
jgi:hypothetical protein